MLLDSRDLGAPAEPSRPGFSPGSGRTVPRDGRFRARPAVRPLPFAPDRATRRSSPAFAKSNPYIDWAYLTFNIQRVRTPPANAGYSASACASARLFPATCNASDAAMNASRSPSSTPEVSEVSTPVRRSLTIWYGCST